MMSIAEERKSKMFEVSGQDHEGRWRIKHPLTGEDCAGTWASKNDAQQFCDQWNAARRRAHA